MSNSITDSFQRYAGIVEYEGTGFGGWQIQPNSDTIQERIEKALHELFARPLKIQGSGRTDAGVHALGQVFHFDAPNKYSTESIINALNIRLDKQIAITCLIPTHEDFHSRFDVVRKEYVYRISTRRIRPVFSRHISWNFSQSLDVEKMQMASKLFLNGVDFRIFTTEAHKKVNTVRNIESIEVTKENGIIEISFCSKGFLYNLVRALTGTLVHVGKGRISIDDLREIMDSGERDMVPPLAPAKGLFLNWVEYREYPELKRSENNGSKLFIT